MEISRARLIGISAYVFILCFLFFLGGYKFNFEARRLPSFSSTHKPSIDPKALISTEIQQIGDLPGVGEAQKALETLGGVFLKTRRAPSERVQKIKEEGLKRVPQEPLRKPSFSTAQPTSPYYVLD